MIRTFRGRHAAALGALFCAALASGSSGCAGGDDAAASGGGAAGSGGDATAGGGGGGSGGTGGVGGAGGGGGVDPGDGGADDAESPRNGGYEGVDLSTVPVGTAPTGCVGGLDTGTKKLSLHLDATVGALLLQAPSGGITANGVACTAGDGSPATAATTESIEVTGGDEDDIVVVDLSQGSFGAAILSSGGAIRGDLGGGHNAFALLGTAGSDVVRAGQSGASVAFDVTNDGAADLFVAGATTLTVSLGPGADTFHATGASGTGDALSASVVVYGGDDDDLLEGGAGDDVLHGGQGRDTFVTASARDGADTYDGGDDGDLIDYSARVEALAVSLDDVANDGASGEGDSVQSTVESVLGGSGDDVLIGSAGANVLVGGKGNDTLSGGDGDDTFDESEPGDGADVLNGGGGADKVTYEGRTANLSITLCASAALVGCTVGECACAANDGEAAEHDTLVNVEHVAGGAGADTMVGDASDNNLYGNGGDDSLSGGDGNDYLYGDEGSDKLFGGNGDDYLDGAAGTDTFDGGGGTGDICIVAASESRVACELY